mmetsp:Transcript_7984/g.16232  ORF Transcript_7984/g.16232 Transcript_7984/m.16232 type:complete len:437 (-) Transcript_7984:72-1382(-)
MFGDDTLAGSYHNDVLNAEPTSSEGKHKLVDEIKNRAKGCISSRNFPVAVQLYGKAIDVLADEGDNSASAILRANRSMCYLSVNNAALALEDAVEAENLDPSYLKVYYRKAAALKALGRFGEAKESVVKGLSLKPDDKEMQSLLAKVEADISTYGAVKKAPVVNAARSTVKTSTVQAGTSTSATQAKATAPSRPAPTPQADEDDEDDVEALGNVRGYKKTADGRVTTFFNHDLDETAKKLIGDIAPKKLDSVQPQAAVETATANGSSVWNSAGTYEERQLSPWASSELKRCLGALAAHISSPVVPGVESADLCVSDVENVVGDAQVSMIRGKKKHLADYCADLKWTLTARLAGVSETVSVNGRLQLLDISADEEYEVGNIEVTHYNGNAASLSSLPQAAGQMVAMYVKKSASAQPQGLQALAHAALLKFCVDLKAK